jgi:hypothetical protein
MNSFTAYRAFSGKKLFNIRRKKSLIRVREMESARMLEKAARLAKATAKHVAGGMKETSPEQLQVRLDICNSCDIRDDITCTHPDCGCNLTRKALWMTEDCPLEKWPKL